MIGLGQSFKTIKEYSFESDLLFLTQFYLSDKSIAGSEFRIYHNRSFGLPCLIIPFGKINDLREFLLKSRDKFYEWDSVRVANGIKEMKKNIDKFGSAIRAIGDDYGVFYGLVSLETNYIALESGRSVMQLYFYVCDEHCVRSDVFSTYVVISDNHKANEAFQKFLDDLNIEFYQEELKKINNKGSLFK